MWTTLKKLDKLQTPLQAKPRYQNYSAEYVIECKDHNARPLNYHCDLKRLTQMFGRNLQIKFYQKEEDRPKKPEPKQ
jgi:hypothetical protein